MEIDFNPSRAPQAEPSQAVVRQEAATPATDETSFQVTTALQDQLKNQPTVRPEKVAQAKALLSDSQYPPDDVLDRIAILIAGKLQSQ
jgi:hypothetical protein